MRIDCALSFRLLLATLLSCSLAGCTGGAGNVHVYYLVNPVTVDEPIYRKEQPLAVEIMDLHIPQYLEKFQIAVRDGENRLRYSEYNQWGENLRKNLIRTMARNLAAMLATEDVGTPQNRSSSMPDYRLHMHIEQFERDQDERVRLVARWQLSDSKQPETLEMHSATLEGQSEIRGSDYDSLVAEMQDLYGQLCQQIAESIRGHETGE